MMHKELNQMQMQKSEQREPSKLDWGWPSRVDFRPKVKNANLQNIQPFPGTDNPEYCNMTGPQRQAESIPPLQGLR